MKHNWSENTDYLRRIAVNPKKFYNNIQCTNCRLIAIFNQHEAKQNYYTFARPGNPMINYEPGCLTDDEYIIKRLLE